VDQRALPSRLNAVWDTISNVLASSPDFHINKIRDWLPTPSFSDSRGIDMVFTYLSLCKASHAALT
jgi:hypothetical protein